MTAILAFLLILLGSAPAAHAATVHKLEYQGAITPVASEYILQGITAAEEAGAVALLLELDTPGGLVDSMRDIVKGFLGAEIPILCHVAPSGAHAASAGVFITMAAHVAAMAPGTNIGSASVVGMAGGEMDSTMRKKVFNDAVAYLESIAEERGRPVEWAARFVDDAANLPASEALAEGVIDYVARDTAELLELAEGRVVEVGGESQRLEFTGVTVERYPMGLRHRILSGLANPQLAYMLLMLGMYGIFFELSNPGSIVPGVLGTIAILLALFALQALPIRWAGLGLIGVSFVLFLMEIHITSYGLLAVAGVVSLGAGSLLLFDGSQGWGGLGLSQILPMVIFTSLLSAGAVFLAVRGQHAPQVTGPESMLATSARIVTPMGPALLGKAVVRGEYWDARSEEPLAPGDLAEVASIDGRELLLRRSAVPSDPEVS